MFEVPLPVVRRENADNRERAEPGVARAIPRQIITKVGEKRDYLLDALDRAVVLFPDAAEVTPFCEAPPVRMVMWVLRRSWFSDVGRVDVGALVPRSLDFYTVPTREEPSRETGGSHA